MTRGEQVDRAFYVYGIGRYPALSPMMNGELPQAIEPEAPLELVPAGCLAAVASAVPAVDYHETALEARLADPEWTTARALRHDGVLRHFASHADVIPLRFGSLYREREGIRKMLEERLDELDEILTRIAGRQEWCVNLYRDSAVLMSRLEALDPRLGEAAARAASASPGQAYLLRKKLDGMRLDAARAETLRVVTDTERSLTAVSDRAVRRPIVESEKTAHGEQVARLVCLVARDRLPEFRGAAEHLAGENAGAGFALELVGPSPPYHFALG